MLALLCFLRCNSQHWDASGSFLAWYLPYLIDVFTKEMSTARYKLNEFHVLRFSYVLLATYGRLNHWKEVVCFNGFPCPAKFKVKVLGILQWNCWPQLFSVSGWGGYHKLRNSSWKIDVWNKRFLLEFFVSWFNLLFGGAVEFHVRRETKK